MGQDFAEPDAGWSGRAVPAPRLRLVRDDARAADTAGPVLDEQQAAVVAHRGGPLLVLGGPGTGKTATVVETVVARLQPPGGELQASQVLVLTFGRRAAGQLRDRIAARLAGGEPVTVATFHSFAYGVVRAHAEPASPGSRPGVLSAGEQDARLRELLAGAIADGRLAWPDDLRGATGTRGIAEQVRSLFARARGLGMDGAALARAGRATGNPAWTALGPFLEEYLDTLGFEAVLDYGELMLRAMLLANDPRTGRALRQRFGLIVVDEFHDTDPVQVAMLRGLASQGADLIVLGDPDQAIYGFRGASVRGILEFPDRFPHPRGGPAPIIVLRSAHRFPADLVRVAARVLPATSLAPLAVEIQGAHRELLPLADAPRAVVTVLTFESASAEARGIADLLLRAHAAVPNPWAARTPGLAPLPLMWSQMAVIVRSPARQLPGLARAMAAAGIPVEMHRGDIPLSRQPAVGAMLDVLAAVLHLEAAAKQVLTLSDLTAELPSGLARALLTGPIGRLSAVQVRSLLRDQSAAGASAAEEGPHESPATPSDPTRDPRPSDAAPPEAPPAHSPVAVARLRDVLARVQASVQAQASPHEVLWAAWSSSDWPDKLQASSLRGGTQGRWADVHIDSVLALFDLAIRMPPRLRGSAGVRSLIAEVAGQQVPVDTITREARSADSVRLISAHRAKGEQWPMVVVAGVQEGRWPDLRLRTQLLRADELGKGPAAGPVSHADLLVQERRLMYVALTRASEQLVVTAVADPLEGGDQPSRFVTELGPLAIPCGADGAPGVGGRDLTVAGLVSRMRSVLPAQAGGDGDACGRRLGDQAAEAAEAAGPRAASASDACAAAGDGTGALARAVARRIGWLAAQVDALGRPLVPVADPQSWWGLNPVTRAPDPINDPSEPLVLSGSMVTAVLDCPLRWFLDRRVGAAPVGGEALTVGLLVHWLAQAVASGQLPADEAELNRQVDLVWDSVAGPVGYYNAQQRARVGRMIGSFLRWQDAHPHRRVLCAELSFRVDLPGTGPGVRLAGSIDRVDIDRDGGLHVVDFKTSQRAETKQRAAVNPQLGIYQLALGHGALAGACSGAAPGPAPRGGSPGRLEGAQPAPAAGAIVGAELVYLGQVLARTGLPTVRHQGPLGDDEGWVRGLLDEVATIVREEDFHARPGDVCKSCTHKLTCPTRGVLGGGLDAD